MLRMVGSRSLLFGTMATDRVESEFVCRMLPDAQ